MKGAHRNPGWIVVALLLAAAPAVSAEDSITVEGLVYQYYVEDDSEEVAIGIEATERDYLVVAGDMEQELRNITGATVRATGQLKTLPNGDVTILVDSYQVLEEPPPDGK